MFIKICGVTLIDDALWAVQQGATAIGVNFYPQSPRYLDYAHARDLLNALPKCVHTVGIFVKPQREQIEHTLSELPLTHYQFYETDAADFRPLAVALKQRVILAKGVETRSDLKDSASQVKIWQDVGIPPFALLLDAKIRGMHGGTGRQPPWNLLRQWKDATPLILAGGLTPDNVAQAIAEVRPWGVDVASGVESVPGRKDPDRVQRFISACRHTYPVA